MKLVLYMYKRFMPVFAGAMIFFSFVLVLVDLLMNLWRFIQNQVPVHDVMNLMLLYLPKTVGYAMPVAILFAASYVLSELYASNELIVIFSSGISLRRFAFPLLALSVVLSFFLFFFEDNVIVPTYAEKVRTQNVLLNADMSKNNDRIVVLSEHGTVIYKADYYDDGQERLYRLYIVVRDEEKRPVCVIYSDTAAWDSNKRHWKLGGAFQYTFENEKIITENVRPEITQKLTEKPETFRNNTISVEEVSTREAREYIEHLQKAGLPSAEAKSVYYKKFSFPFVLFIVVFLSVGLSGRTRKNVLLISLFLCVGSSVLFYVTQMVTMLLAKFGYIPPVLGAWFPVFLFVIISYILVKYSRT